MLKIFLIKILFQVCFEKRLVISHDLNDAVSTAAAYGELGDIHKLLGNFEQSINCMERRLEMARSGFNQLNKYQTQLVLVMTRSH